ncbi:MAG: HD domain-containing protein, partial [Paracoccaceae bacterium]
MNYGFYIGATPENVAELAAAERTPGIKIFIGSSTGDLLVDDQDALERIFGEKVAFIVEGLTKIAKIEFASVRERQAQNFRKMLTAMSTDIRILLIKLADRLHNMRT